MPTRMLHSICTESNISNLPNFLGKAALGEDANRHCIINETMLSRRQGLHRTCHDRPSCRLLRHPARSTTTTSKLPLSTSPSFKTLCGCTWPRWPILRRQWPAYFVPIKESQEDCHLGWAGLLRAVPKPADLIKEAMGISSSTRTLCSLPLPCRLAHHTKVLNIPQPSCRRHHRRDRQHASRGLPLRAWQHALANIADGR